LFCDITKKNGSFLVTSLLQFHVFVVLLFFLCKPVPRVSFARAFFPAAVSRPQGWVNRRKERCFCIGQERTFLSFLTFLASVYARAVFYAQVFLCRHKRRGSPSQEYTKSREKENERESLQWVKTRDWCTAAHPLSRVFCAVCLSLFFSICDFVVFLFFFDHVCFGKPSKMSQHAESDVSMHERIPFNGKRRTQGGNKATRRQVWKRKKTLFTLPH